MHAYLITGYNKQKIEEVVSDLVKKTESRRLGFDLKKIADVKELVKFTNLTLSEKSVIVIENIDEASRDAQNAFLKALEEPQEKLNYILTASSVDSVIPTIASRCQVIESGGKNEIDKETSEKINKFLDLGVGEKIKEVSKITKREDATEFMKNVILVLHIKLQSDKSLVHSIELAAKTLKYLEANGNVSIQLTNFVINI